MKECLAVIGRCTEYLACGGLFNPELANHDAVSMLVRDARAALMAAVERVNERDRARVAPLMVQADLEHPGNVPIQGAKARSDVSSS